MSNIMMGIVAEMLAAHGAKLPAEEVPIEVGEGMLDALEAETEGTFAAVLAENPVASTKAPEDIPLPKIPVGEESESQVTGLVEQAPVRLDSRSPHTTPRIPFEVTELPKPPAPKEAVETDYTDTSFETNLPENTLPSTKIEAAPSAAQASDRPRVDPLLTDKTAPVETPVIEAVQRPEHTTEWPSTETVPTKQQPVVGDTPTPPLAEDPISAEVKPRDLPLERSESAETIAQQMKANNAGEQMDIPVKPSQDRPGVTDANQDAERPDVKARGQVPSQVMVGDPISTATAPQIAIPPEAAKRSQTHPDVSELDPIPAKVPQTDEPDLDTWVTASQPTTPPAPKPSADFVPVSPETDPRQSTPIANDPRNGMDTPAPADVSADSAPNPSTLPSAPPSTAQTPTPHAAAPTVIDLPQVDNSGPTTSATPPVQTERDVPPVAQQIAIAVSKSDGGTIELALRPVELGETQISMEFEAERLVVTVATERAETQDLMRRQIDDLAREFRDLGYRDVSFRFEQQTGQQGQSRQAQGAAQNMNQAETEPDLFLETPAPRPTYVSGRLDIRL